MDPAGLSVFRQFALLLASIARGLPGGYTLTTGRGS